VLAEQAEGRVGDLFARSLLLAFTKA